LIKKTKEIPTRH